MGKRATPERFEQACHVLWCLEKEFTYLQTAIALGVNTQFVKKVVAGGTCAMAIPKTPPDELITALAKL